MPDASETLQLFWRLLFLALIWDSFSFLLSTVSGFGPCLVTGIADDAKRTRGF